MSVLFTEDRKSIVGQALMYMQQRHMVCGKLDIYHYLDLDQSVYDNAYPNPLLHKALDGNDSMVILVIG